MMMVVMTVKMAINERGDAAGDDEDYDNDEEEDDGDVKSLFRCHRSC